MKMPFSREIPERLKPLIAAKSDGGAEAPPLHSPGVGESGFPNGTMKMPFSREIPERLKPLIAAKSDGGAEAPPLTALGRREWFSQRNDEDAFLKRDS